MALPSLPSYLISVGILLTLMVVDLIYVCPIKNTDNKNRKKLEFVCEFPCYVLHIKLT